MSADTSDAEKATIPSVPTGEVGDSEAVFQTAPRNYIPDSSKEARYMIYVVSGFVFMSVVLIFAFSSKISKDRVVFTDSVNVVGITGLEEIKGNQEVYSRVAADYAGYIYNRSAAGLDRAEMLPLICEDNCRAEIQQRVAATTAMLAANRQSQQCIVNDVKLIKRTSNGVVVAVSALLRRYSVAGGSRAEPIADAPVMITMTLAYSRRAGEKGMIPFLLTNIEIENTDI